MSGTYQQLGLFDPPGTALSEVEGYSHRRQRLRETMRAMCTDDRTVRTLMGFVEACGDSDSLGGYCAIVPYDSIPTHTMHPPRTRADRTMLIQKPNPLWVEEYRHKHYFAEELALSDPSAVYTLKGTLCQNDVNTNHIYNEVTDLILRNRPQAITPDEQKRCHRLERTYWEQIAQQEKNKRRPLPEEQSAMYTDSYIDAHNQEIRRLHHAIWNLPSQQHIAENKLLDQAQDYMNQWFTDME